MAEEVKRRLDEVKMLGRMITLKVMKRDPSAPVEPPKVCSLWCFRCPILNLKASFLDMENVTPLTNNVNWLVWVVAPSTTIKLSVNTPGGCSNLSTLMRRT